MRQKLSANGGSLVWATIGCAVACSLASLKYLPFPYGWALGVWVVACGLLAWRATNESARVIWFNVGAVLLVVAGAELFAAARYEPPEVAGYPTGYMIRDDDLGTVPARSFVADVQRWNDSTLVYQVTYSINPNGLRRAPPDRGSDIEACGLFFGDSFMFGEGLNDEEAAPYRVGVLSNGYIRTHNLAFHGYGGHQMLSALENGRVDDAIDCAPTHVVFEALPDHVARTAGLRSWDRHGPRYELTANGQVQRRGNFDDDERSPAGWRYEFQWQLNKSHLHSWFRARAPKPTEADIQRYVAVVMAASRLVQLKYPVARFSILLWPMREAGPAYERIFERLHKEFTAIGLDVHTVDAILPGFLDHPARYQIGPSDLHPNARANDMIARYVLSEVFR